MTIQHALSRLAMLMATLAIPAAVSADLVVTLQPTTQELTVGSSGFLDVFVTGSSATADPVAAYSIELLGESGITYTGVSAATAATNGYLFPSTPGPQVSSTSPDLAYADVSAAAPTNITTAETYGVGRIFFDAVTPGTYTIEFAGGGQSAFIRSNATDISTTFTGATIIVTAAVPEPSTTVLLGLTSIAGLVATRLRRKRPGTAT